MFYQKSFIFSGSLFCFQIFNVKLILWPHMFTMSMLNCSVFNWCSLTILWKFQKFWTRGSRQRPAPQVYLSIAAYFEAIFTMENGNILFLNQWIEWNFFCIYNNDKWLNTWTNSKSSLNDVFIVKRQTKNYFRKYIEKTVNNGRNRPKQKVRPRSDAASDQGLHCLQLTL